MHLPRRMSRSRRVLLDLGLPIHIGGLRVFPDIPTGVPLHKVRLRRQPHDDRPGCARILIGLWQCALWGFVMEAARKAPISAGMRLECSSADCRESRRV